MAEMSWNGDCWRRATAETFELIERDKRAARPVVRGLLEKLPGMLCASLGIAAPEGRGPRRAAIATQLSATAMLNECGLARGEVEALFHADTKQSLAEYIKRAYFEIALWFLFCTDSAVTVVGELAGFSSHQQFYRTVKRLIGITAQELDVRVRALKGLAAPLNGLNLHSRKLWRSLRDGSLKRRFVERIWDLLQRIYPDAAREWREDRERSDLGGPRLDARLMEAVWSLLQRPPRGQTASQVLQIIGCDSADLFHFLCAQSLNAGREAPDRGVEVMELALECLRSNAEPLGGELAELELVGLARLGNAHSLASQMMAAERHWDAASRGWNNAGPKPGGLAAEMTVYRSKLLMLQGRQAEAERLLGGGDPSSGTFPTCPGREALEGM